MTSGGVHHVALAVTDLERSVAWYRAVFDVPAGAIVNFKDADGIALAVFWDAPASDNTVAST